MKFISEARKLPLSHTLVIDVTNFQGVAEFQQINYMRSCEHKIQKVLLNAEKGLSGEFQERLYNFRVAYPYVGK